MTPSDEIFPIMMHLYEGPCASPAVIWVPPRNPRPRVWILQPVWSVVYSQACMWSRSSTLGREGERMERIGEWAQHRGGDKSGIFLEQHSLCLKEVRSGGPRKASLGLEDSSPLWTNYMGSIGAAGIDRAVCGPGLWSLDWSLNLFS